VDDGGIAKADVDGGRAGDSVQGPIQRVQAELAGLFRARLHVRFVDLHDIGAGREQIADLLVHGGRVVDGSFLFGRIVVVLCLLTHRERAGDRHLD
jgi:hypothetical protein